MEKRKTWLIFTLEYFISCALMFSVFWYHGKTILRYCDGLNQYYYTLCYYGEWLREICGNIFIRHTFQIPLWDLSIGYGADILTTLHYYGLGDPLNLLAVFVDRAHMETLLVALLLLRLYLAGISFQAFCRYHRCEEQAIRIASLVYCFSGWTLLSGIRWMEFVTPLIFLPLILMGIDRIYRGESGRLLCISSALAAFSSVYFFYMLCFAALIYGIAGYFSYRQPLRLSEIGKWFLRFVQYFGIGAGCAAVIWLPVGMALLGGSRVGAAGSIPLLFEKGFYLALPVSFILAADVYKSISAGWGFAPLAVGVLILLFSNRKRNRTLKILFFISAVIFCIPYCNHVLNGFGYVAHRWVWANVLIVGYGTAKIYPETGRLTKKQRLALGAACICYGGLLYYVLGLTGYAVFIYILLLLAMAGMALGQGKRLSAVLLHGITLAWIAVNCWHLYGAAGTFGYENYVDLAGADRIARTENVNLLTRLPSGEPYRYDTYGTGRYANWNLASLLGIYGTQFYYSIADSNVFDYYKAVSAQPLNDFSYQDLDGRCVLDTLAGVRYFMVKNGEEQYLPYGYRKPAVREEKYGVYQTELYLPMAYAYDCYLPGGLWEDYGPVRKQWAMLQGCVLEESDFPECRPEFSERRMELEYPAKIEKADGQYCLRTEEANTTLTFRLPGDTRADEEVYLLFDNLDLRKDVETTDITVARGRVEKRYELRTVYDSRYCGVHDLLFNLGTASEGAKIEITFEEPGTYVFDDLYLLCQPMEKLEAYVEQRKSGGVFGLTIEGNEVHARMAAEKGEIVLFALPYHPGWRAFLDGEETKLKRANGMFMAVEVPAGVHEITLRYRTRGLAAGGILSAASVCAAIVFAARKKKENG